MLCFPASHSHNINFVPERKIPAGVRGSGIWITYLIRHSGEKPRFCLFCFLSTRYREADSPQKCLVLMAENRIRNWWNDNFPLFFQKS